MWAFKGDKKREKETEMSKCKCCSQGLKATHAEEQTHTFIYIYVHTYTVHAGLEEEFQSEMTLNLIRAMIYHHSQVVLSKSKQILWGNKLCSGATKKSES